MRALLCVLTILAAGSTCAAERNGHERATKHEPRMSFLDNGVVRVGVDLSLGGAITYLSKSGGDRNMVNSWDLGRQIQMSYYAGPVPFEVGEKKPAPQWVHIGWNPIQVGDHFGNPAKVLVEKNDGKQIYVKCVPMHWPLDDVPGECTFESWLELDGPAVRARCRFVNDRPDHTQWPARGQELPAVYTNGPWYRLMTYTGDAPFTGGASSRIEHPFTDKSPWASFLATEHWAALVDDEGFGVGVFNPGVVRFSGGFAGKPGAGGPHDNPTGYIAPHGHEILDWNVTHDYRYDLIVGSLDDIRAYVYAHAPKAAAPEWRFDKDRAGWTYQNATDAGWPIKGELVVDLGKHNPQLVGPIGFWKAQDAGTLVVEAACKVRSPAARVYWRTLADPGFNAAHSLPVQFDAGDEYHAYRIKLAGVPGWDGAIVQVRLDPDLGEADHAGDWIRVRSVRFEK